MQKTESSEGSEAFHSPWSRDLRIPAQKLSGLSQELYFKVWPAEPKPPPTFEDQLPETGFLTRANLSAWGQNAEARCQPTVHAET